MCIASIASYVFFCRGECGACARSEDLVVDDTHLTLRLNKGEGQQHLREGRKNTRQNLVDDMPRVAKAIKDYFEGMRMMKPEPEDGLSRRGKTKANGRQPRARSGYNWF